MTINKTKLNLETSTAILINVAPSTFVASCEFVRLHSTADELDNIVELAKGESIVLTEPTTLYATGNGYAVVVENAII